MYEVAKHISMIDMGPSTGYTVLMNQDVWKSLTADQQRVILEVSKDSAKYDLDSVNKLEAEGRSQLEAKGVTFYDFPDKTKWYAQLPDFIGMWVKEMEGKGLGAPAQDVAKGWRAILAGK